MYQDGILPTVDFVTEPLSLATASVINPSSAPQTWSSVIKQQVDLIERSDLKKNTIGSSVPFWTLAETGEVHLSLHNMLVGLLMDMTSLVKREFHTRLRM